MVKANCLRIAVVVGLVFMCLEQADAQPRCLGEANMSGQIVFADPQRTVIEPTAASAAEGPRTVDRRADYSVPTFRAAAAANFDSRWLLYCRRNAGYGRFFA